MTVRQPIAADQEKMRTVLVQNILPCGSGAAVPIAPSYSTISSRRSRGARRSASASGAFGLRMSGPGGFPIIRRASASRAAVHRGMGLAAGWVFVICAFFIAADVIGRNFLGVSSPRSS